VELSTTRGHKLCSHWAVPKHVMEPKDSLAYSQEISTCTYPEPDKSSNTNSTGPTSILFTHLCLGRHSGLFPSNLPTNNLYTFLLSPIHATCPTQLIISDLIILIMFGEVFKSGSSSLCSFLRPPPVISHHFGANILFKHPQSTFIPHCQRPSITLVWNDRQNYKRHQLSRENSLKL
jgi:hypothetical protein